MPQVPGPHKTVNVKLSTLQQYQSFWNVDVKICKGNWSSLELSLLLILLGGVGCLVLPCPASPLHVLTLLTVSIEVVEDGHAGLLLPTLLGLLPVVWLGPVRPPGVGPVSELRPVGRTHLDLVGRPEPTVDVLGEELWLVATVKVTFPAGGPEVRDVPINKTFDPVILLLGLEGDQVHAPLPAVVPGVEPVPLGVLHAVVVVLPAEPVEVPVEPLDAAFVNS